MVDTTPSFAEFFSAVHGFDPFPWQEALAAQVANGIWPGHIDIPTGLGKTSVIDIALYCLAVDATRPPADRRARTRIALVVDRRLIVDAAHGHAATLVEQIDTATNGPASWAANALRSMTGGDTAVAVQRMRGGLTWSSLWSKSPAQPLVLLATIDQLGSRFLFRGYGTTDQMKPIDSGLVGNDTLILLDEAHLSQAFAETAQSCLDIQRQAHADPLAQRPTTFVQMTATPVERQRSLITQNDLRHPVAAARLAARKNVVLIDVPSATSPAKAAAEVGQVLGHLALGIASREAIPTVLVTANTVDAARKAFDVVHAGGVECALVVGRARGIDRETQQRRWLDRTRTGRDRNAATQPFVLVATQTVEVGVDIDVDALVTEIAPIDSLVQRFGRVDRIGELGDTTSYVVRVPSRLVDDPPPYRSASSSTWDWLTSKATQVGTASATGGVVDSSVSGIDFGTQEMREQLDVVSELSDLIAPRGLPPVVMPATVGVWRRTSPVPDPDESIVSYLHGVGSGQPKVTLLWRCDLPVVEGSDTFDLALPVGRHETVEVSLAAARLFIGGSESPDTSDLEGEPEAVTKDQPRDLEVEAFVFRDDGWQRLRTISTLRPGDMIVLDITAGGHDEWSFIGARATESSKVPTDVAELDPTRPASLRLNRLVVENLIGRGLAPSELNLLRTARDLDTTATERIRHIQELMATLRDRIDEHCRYPQQVTDLLGALSTGNLTIDSPPVDVHSDSARPDAGGSLIRVSGTLPPAVSDDDVASSSLTGQAVTLDSHLESVGDRAQQFAQQCGLSPELVAAARLAGRFHDLGKADERFQALLSGGPRWLAETRGPDASELLAKSQTQTREQNRAARASSGWPSGYRHEAISLALVANADADLFQGVDRHLVEHLVAAHHGRARPLFPAIFDDAVTTTVQFAATEFKASSIGSHPAWGQPDRFHNLCERYGPWGLAYLEAVVRLADIAISTEGR